jgi:hypothetical protein
VERLLIGFYHPFGLTFVAIWCLIGAFFVI